jgi:hypothetical protein
VPLQCTRGGAAPPDVVLANDAVAATFSGVDGRLASLADVATGTTMRVQQTLMAYATTKSGAYLFTPSGPASPVATAACPLGLLRWAGPVADVLVWTLLENATATAPDGRLQLRATLVHAAGDLSRALQMEIAAPGALSPNREVVLRWSTDLANNVRHAAATTTRQTHEQTTTHTHTHAYHCTQTHRHTHTHTHAYHCTQTHRHTHTHTHTRIPLHTDADALEPDAGWSGWAAGAVGGRRPGAALACV